MGEVTFLDVSKRFSLRVDGELHHVQALDRVSFTVHDGEIVALIGPSGCGKTTALRVAMGLDPRPAPAASPSTAARCTAAATTAAWCSSTPNCCPGSPPCSNVMFGLEMKGMRGAELHDTAEKYLELVGLTDSQNRRPHQLSGGMKPARRHCPCARHRSVRAADGRAVRRARRADARVDAGRVARHPRPHRKTILFVTHDLDEAVLIADRIVIMREGRVADIMTVPAKRPRDLARCAARRNSPRPATRSGARCTTSRRFTNGRYFR